MYVSICLNLKTNSIDIIHHNSSLSECRMHTDNVINTKIALLNTDPDIIYARKYDNNYRDVIIYRIGFTIQTGYIYSSKMLINDDLFCYRIFYISDEKYYQTTFSHVIVDDIDEKKNITIRTLPEDLQLAIKRYQK